MFLVCQTTDDIGGYEFAAVEMTPEVARELLRYRPLYQEVAAHDASLYCLKFFDGRAADGSGFDHISGTDLTGSSGWYASRSDPGLDEGSDVAAATLKVAGQGLLWSASPRHDNGYFETPELTWGQLESLSEGGAPFDEAFRAAVPCGWSRGRSMTCATFGQRCRPRSPTAMT